MPNKQMVEQHMNIYNKKWGYEIWIENNDEYCGKHLHIVPNKKCSVHYHKLKKETFYIISGTLTLEYGNHLDRTKWENLENINIIHLTKGQSFTIDRNIAHRFYVNGFTPCDFIEISTHHDETDSYRIIESQ